MRQKTNESTFFLTFAIHYIRNMFFTRNCTYLFVILFATSCSKEELDSIVGATDSGTRITITNYLQHDNTSNISSSPLEHLTLLADGTRINHNSSEESYNTFHLDLQPGTHKITAIGYSGASEIKDATHTCIKIDPIPDFFCTHKQLETTDADLTEQLKLERVVAAIELHSTDNCPKNAKTLEICFLDGGCYNPTTGMACEASAHTYEADIADIRGYAIDIPAMYTFVPATKGTTTNLSIRLTTYSDSNEQLSQIIVPIKNIEANKQFKVETAFFRNGDDNGNNNNKENDEKDPTPSEPEEKFIFDPTNPVLPISDIKAKDSYSFAN